MRYPNDFVDHEGRWGRIHRGHRLSRGILRADLEHNLGTPTEPRSLVVQEVWFDYRPHMKWCSRYDGFGCDNEGEWHNHWFEVKPREGCEFTITRWEDPPMTPTDPDQAREALATKVAHARQVTELGRVLAETDPTAQHRQSWWDFKAEQLLANRDAVLRALGIDETALGQSIELLTEGQRKAEARAKAAEAERRDLVSRLGFGDNITEPMEDNDTIVRLLDDQAAEASEWVESQRWRDECYQAGHPDDEDCWEHDPSLRLDAAERKVARVEALHVKHRIFEVCLHDNVDWPCPTIAALADEVDDSNDESSAQTTGHAGSQETT